MFDPGVTAMAKRNWCPNGWKVRLIGAVPQDTRLQMRKVEARKMTAVVVNVIFPPHFAVRRDINAGFDLNFKDFPGSSREQRFMIS